MGKLQLLQQPLRGHIARMNARPKPRQPQLSKSQLDERPAHLQPVTLAPMGPAKQEAQLRSAMLTVDFAEIAFPDGGAIRCVCNCELESRSILQGGDMFFENSLDFSDTCLFGPIPVAHHFAVAASLEQGGRIGHREGLQEQASGSKEHEKSLWGWASNALRDINLFGRSLGSKTNAPPSGGQTSPLNLVSHKDAGFFLCRFRRSGLLLAPGDLARDGFDGARSRALRIKREQ